MIKYIAVLRNKTHPGDILLYEYESDNYPRMLDVIRYGVIQYQKSTGYQLKKLKFKCKDGELYESEIQGFTTDDLKYNLIGIFEKEHFDDIKALLSL